MNRRERIKAEIAHLNKKIDHMSELAERDEMTSEHYEDLDNWTGWRDALMWVIGGCKGNPHEGDGY